MGNVSIVNSLCSGCGMCSNVCPKKAILMKPGPGGYLYPKIDEATKCNDCGTCLDKCPVNNTPCHNDISPRAFLARSDLITRTNSSSGGLFRIFAQQVISKGGYVIGAIFDEKLNVKLVSTNKLEMIEKMSGSKYVQSSTDLIYQDTRNLLESGQTVLFTGCPCHVAALYNFLGKKYNNLLTVDFICHGPLSQKMLDAHLRDMNFSQPVKSINFRDKAQFGWSSHGIAYCFDDNEKKAVLDPTFVKVFSSNLGTRPSCVDCKFLKTPRQADITIGDYWNAKGSGESFDDNTGVSLLLVNSLGGSRFISEIKDNFELFVEKDYNYVIKKNRRGKLSIPPNHDRFIQLFDKYDSLEQSFSHVVNWKYDVGIFGVVNNTNYGGLLTYYALYKVVEKLGFDVIMLNNPNRGGDTTANTYSRKFFKTHTSMSVQRPVEKQREINDHVSKVILGSDQVWNYSLFKSWKNLLYLDFVDDSKLKISYAASFGHDHHTIPEELIGTIGTYLNRFDYISVRENEGVSITSKNFSLDS